MRDAGAITLGYRESSVSFSYLVPRNEPIGYSVELYKSLVAAIEEAVNKSLEIKWVAVTSASRMDAVEKGQVDLECGPTTNDLERQKRVLDQGSRCVRPLDKAQAMRTSTLVLPTTPSRARARACG